MALWQQIALDILVLLITTGFAMYLNSIKKGVGKVETKIDEIDGKVDELGNKINVLDTTVKEHTITITEITLLDNVLKRIEIKVKQALDYIDPEDKLVSAFILSMGEHAKDCIEWAIHNKLQVKENEIVAKYESCNLKVRELILQTEPEFSNTIRPVLLDISNHHVQRVIQIATDKLFNSKLDRFFTLTEQTTNEVLTTVVRGRLQYKMDHTKDTRML